MTKTWSRAVWTTQGQNLVDRAVRNLRYGLKNVEEGFKHRYPIPDQVVISEDATYRLQVGGERALAAMFPNPMWCTHGGGIGLPGWNCMTVEM